jgi:RNA polymerase sigma factor (sigma-70 family)
MTTGQVPNVLQYLRGLFRAPGADQSDRQMLERFAATRDEAAFAALVERHAPLVWGVCRRVLGHEHDAEDAFQATFLVLARRAGSVRWRDDIGNWLYAVAVKVARKARARAERRRSREREAQPMPNRDAFSEADRNELRAVLDEEIAYLPEKYRRPVVLCCLQGKTYGEAAQLLGWPEGTVSGRLARARELLTRRLTRRGLTLSGGLLAAVLVPEVGSAAPPALVQLTIKTAPAFALGRGLTAGAATALAEGVLQTMFLTKLKVAAVVLVVAVVAVGAGVGVIASTRRDEKPPQQPLPRPVATDDKAPRPPLPREWADRWVVDPFAGAESIEVRHVVVPGKGHTAGGGATYVIKDPKKLAALLKEVKVEAVHNDISVGSIPPAHLTVRKKDGSTFRAGIESDGSLSCDGGFVYLDEQFFTALNRQLSEQEKKKVNVLEHLPPPPEPDLPRQPEVWPSLRSLTAGFTELEIHYSVGKRLHRARITDEKTLDALHKALSVVKQEAVPKGQVGGLNLLIKSKDKSYFNGRVLSETEFYDFNAGKFTVTPDFFKALGKEVGRLEGRDIDVVKENAFTERQVKRGQEFRKLLDDVRSLSFTRERGGKKETIVVDQSDAVANLLKALTWAEVPTREPKLDKGEPLAELTTKGDKKVAVTLLKAGPDNEGVGCSPLLGELVEVEGFGPVWIDNPWKYRLQQHAFELELAAKERRELETAALVCRDFPAFLKQVLNVVASYREGESELNGRVTGDDSRAIIAALAAGKLEKLDWTRERWEKELRDVLDRGAGSLDLTPGLGFKLMLVVTGEKEMLIPMVGRLTFEKSPLPAVRKAIDAEKAKDVELLPRAK